MRSRYAFSPAALVLLAACSADPTGVTDPPSSGGEAERGSPAIGTGLSTAPVADGPAFGSRVGEAPAEDASRSSTFVGSGSRAPEEPTASSDEDSPMLGGGGARASTYGGGGI